MEFAPPVRFALQTRTTTNVSSAEFIGTRIKENMTKNQKIKKTYRLYGQ
jgi:hypothetical protein